MIKHKFYLGIVLVFLVSIQFVTTSCAINSHVGNGHVVKEERDISGFNSISASAGLNIYLTQSDEEQLTVEADENLMDYIITEVRGNELKCTVDGNIYRSSKLNVYVSYSLLNSISVSSGADIETENVLRSNEIIINASSGADADLLVESETISCQSSSGANIKLKGLCEQFNANSSSGADIKAADLSSKSAEVVASSAGDIRISVSERISANASSGGDIVFYGSPKNINIDESSGGDVKQY
ncbi:MAG: DUF2807 domain-containing protein [Prolixibacteraceae bacterium]|nr:DUF2807 domain-containing protein [Prolixibacteraceae bacterium]MBN2649706.1 DUF2807 domain-containing protein [Prolixibacteraceae bacterium]